MPAYRTSDATGFGNKQATSSCSFKRKKGAKLQQGETEAGSRPLAAQVSLAVRLSSREGAGCFIPEWGFWGAEFLWGQSSSNGQGISMMEHSVPVSEVIHLSRVPSELYWRESTIIQYLQMVPGNSCSSDQERLDWHRENHCAHLIALVHVERKIWLLERREFQRRQRV